MSLCDVLANDSRLKQSQVKRVVMVDNDDNINWDHVELLNKFHQGKKQVICFNRCIQGVPLQRRIFCLP